MLALVVILTGCAAINSLRPGHPAASSKTVAAKQTSSTKAKIKSPSTAQSVKAKKAPPLDTAAVLMMRAEEAYQKNNLMMPLNDNAFDRYQAVLLLRPGHKGAIAGLQKIAQRYCSLAQKALTQRDGDRSREMLARARQAYQHHECIGPLAGKIRKLPVSVVSKSKNTYVKPDLSGNDFKLPKADLSHRNQNIKQLLSEIAQQAKLRGMAFLIVARDDKEGRWIYNEMRKSVPGYRLRGNIERGSVPRISFERELIGM
jgi:hypothetical protein